MDLDRRLLIRMSEEQHKAFRVRAAELGVPMSEIVRALVELWLECEVQLPAVEQRGRRQ